MARLTSVQRRACLERFTAFLKERGFSWLNESSKYRFIVSDGQELIMVYFPQSGKVMITARQGQVKAVLLSWLRQEGHRIEDHADPSEWRSIERLEKEYGYLLHSARSLAASSSPEHLLADAILLDPAENQLAEVACLLGYRIYQRALFPRYLVLSQDHRVVVTGDRLTVTLVDLIRSMTQAEGV